MNARPKKILAGVGYGAWFLLLFVILTWLTFPWSRLRDQAMVGAAESGWALQIDSMSSAFVGVKAKGLTLAKAARADDTPPTPLIELDKIKVKTGIFGALRSALAVRSISARGGVRPSELVQELLAATGHVDLDARLYDGRLRLGATSEGDAARFSLNADRVELTRYVLQTDGFAADPRGRLRATGDVLWHWEEPKNTSGNLDIVFDDLVLSGAKIGFFGLPETAFMQSEAHVKFGRGKAELRDTIFEADEVTVVVEGFVTLKKLTMKSKLALKLRFKLRSDLDGLTTVAFGSNPTHKDKDGWYHYQVNGTLDRPRLRPSPASVRSSRGGDRRSGGNRRSTRGGDVEEDDDDDDDDKASRRNKRTKPSGERIDREPMSDTDRAGQEEDRERLREERLRRREERRERREELMRRRRERQEELDAGGRNDGRSGSTLESDIEDEILRSNYPPNEEGEPDLLEEIEGELEEIEGEELQLEVEPLLDEFEE